MRRLTAVWAVGLAAIVGSCSDTPRLAPPPDLDPDLLAPAEPEIFAVGTVNWGPSADKRFSWELEAVPGFTNAVTMTLTAEAKISVRSAIPDDLRDPVWLVGIVFNDGAPPVVFGGADEDVDLVILVNAQGHEQPLELLDLPDRNWSLAIQELPGQWAELVDTGIEAVALRDGVEVARETVIGLS